MIDLNLVSYNMKRIQNSQKKKRNKIFECLRNDIKSNGLIFLDEIYFLAKDA